VFVTAAAYDVKRGGVAKTESALFVLVLVLVFVSGAR